MRRYLIVANQTLAAEELSKAVSDRLAAGPAEFWVLVPATRMTDLASPAFLPGMGGVPVPVPASVAESERLARARLDAALDRLRSAGVTVGGEVGDPDPFQAIEHTLATRQFDEIVVSTLPARLSRWLRQDLPSRVERTFHVPVTHIGAAQVPSR
jgi:nucleotide-binding universal stress UspA family protein